MVVAPSTQGPWVTIMNRASLSVGGKLVTWIRNKTLLIVWSLLFWSNLTYPEWYKCWVNKCCYLKWAWKTLFFYFIYYLINSLYQHLLSHEYGQELCWALGVYIRPECLLSGPSYLVYKAPYLDPRSLKPYSQLVHPVELVISFWFISYSWEKDEYRSKKLKLILQAPYLVTNTS